MASGDRQWTPVLNRIMIRASEQDSPTEGIRTPVHNDRALRPKPLRIPSKQPCDPHMCTPTSAWPESSREGVEDEHPRDPEVIDIGPVSEWQRRKSPAQRNHRVELPSSASPCSGRQSEISLGILDYYTREQTPSAKSPPLPAPATRKIDGAIDRLHSALPPTPTPSTNVPMTPTTIASISLARAMTRSQTDPPMIPISPPSAPQPSATLNRGYSLFPVIKLVTPPPLLRRQPSIAALEPSVLHPTSAATTITPVPRTTYRPRKESIAFPSRPRNNSLHSLRHQLAQRHAPIPLRILSNTTASSSSSSKPLPPSPPRIIPTTTIPTTQSRWSDDTITSPTTASTPALGRSSLGSVVRRESAQYPACFFEDDDGDDDDDDGCESDADEAAPLRRTYWAWKKQRSSASSASSAASSVAASSAGAGVSVGVEGRQVRGMVLQQQRMRMQRQGQRQGRWQSKCGGDEKGIAGGLLAVGGRIGKLFLCGCGGANRGK